MDSGMELVWFDIDLETVEPYAVWKPESVEWALTVDWARVNELVRRNVNDFPADDFAAAMRSADRLPDLTPADRAGLGSLYQEPIFATPRQISSGGHRITAMRQQNVRWALGTCHLADIGEGSDASVHPLHAYATGPPPGPS
jgi:hypothetical protein